MRSNIILECILLEKNMHSKILFGTCTWKTKFSFCNAAICMPHLYSIKILTHTEVTILHKINKLSKHRYFCVNTVYANNVY